MNLMFVKSCDFPEAQMFKGEMLLQSYERPPAFKKKPKNLLQLTN